MPPDARFRLDSIPLDEQIAALAVTDLNGDGRPDLVFYGDGKDLEIIYNHGTNGWSDPQRWHIDDGQMNPNALAVGDLNGDDRPDIVLLGDNGSLYFLPQQADHTFGEPQKLPYSGTPKAVQIADVNGDGRNDMLLVDWDSPTPFRFRLQNAAGQLGPEIYFKTQPIHAYCADNLEGNSNLFVVTIAAKFRTGPKSRNSRAGRREFYPARSDKGSFKSCRCARPARRSGACCGRMSMATAGPTCLWPSRTAGRFPFLCSSRTARSAAPRNLSDAGRRQPDRGGGLEC